MDNYFIYFILGAMLLIYMLSSFSQLEKKISNIEKKLDRISKQLGIEEVRPDGLDRELLQLISQGKKIRAIKRYREAANVGLKEAKDYIDALAENNSYN